jgi:hypothetical protein
VREPLRKRGGSPDPRSTGARTALAADPWRRRGRRDPSSVIYGRKGMGGQKKFGSWHVGKRKLFWGMEGMWNLSWGMEGKNSTKYCWRRSGSHLFFYNPT